MALIWATLMWILRHTPEASAARAELCRAYNIFLGPAESSDSIEYGRRFPDGCWGKFAWIAFFDWMYRSFVETVFFAACIAFMISSGMGDALYASVAACDILAFLFRVLITYECSAHAKRTVIMNEKGRILETDAADVCARKNRDAEDEFFAISSIHRYYILVCVLLFMWHAYALSVSEKTVAAVVSAALHGFMSVFAVMESWVVTRVGRVVLEEMFRPDEYARI